MKHPVLPPSRSGLPAKASCRPKPWHRKMPAAGFTLIELSIVLVIIALLIGGVLVGREMIKAAKLRGFITQIERYNAAFNVFQEKYDCLPGDCLNESQFFSGLHNGDGNGLINDQDAYSYSGDRWFGVFGNPTAAYADESADAFAALSQAGLIPDTLEPTSGKLGVSFPYVAGQTNNGFMVAAWNGTNYYRTGIIGVWNGGTPRTGTPAGNGNSSSFTPIDALYIDSKLDDGTPMGGKLRWVEDCAFNCFSVDHATDPDTSNWQTGDGPLDANNPSCFSSVANQFNVLYTDNSCDAAIPGQF